MKIVDKLKSYKGPVAIFPIGVSGSGKSYIFNQTNFKDWAILSSDELRKNYLIKMKRRKNRLIVNGKKEIANPKNAAHIFHPTLREWVFTETQKQIQALAIKKKNCLMDLTNIHLQRVYAFNLLRKYNYTIIAVIFKTRSTQHHLKNVKKRSQKGGIDLAPNSTHFPDQVRQRIILEQKNCMRAFLKTLKKGSCKFEKLPKISQTYLKTSLPSFEKYLKSVPAKHRNDIRKLSRLDQVDVIFKI